MKSIIIATTLVASILANALAVQAAPQKREKLDGHKLFEDIASRSGG